MNIDFHYGIIYVTARLAGLDQQGAQIVAHSCQYVDDATTHGLLGFVDGETFERFASAHQLFDYKNSSNDENRVVWVPFHFLPGGQGESLEEKAICRPDSDIAREMVGRVIDDRKLDNSLHRLGVGLHVYVDTWAHQGFSGIVSKHNWVFSLDGDDHNHGTWREKLAGFVGKTEETIEARLLDAISGLGHGAALHFPDLPWAKWKYTNGHNIKIERDNLPEFIQAADMACRAVQGFLKGNRNYLNESGIEPKAKQAIKDLLSRNRSHDENARLEGLMQAVESGEVPGVKEPIPEYIAKGTGSWKHAATGILDVGDGDDLPRWSPTFESSDYRKFHDAIKQHRYIVTQEILPSKGVRLA